MELVMQQAAGSDVDGSVQKPSERRQLLHASSSRIGGFSFSRAAASAAAASKGEAETKDSGNELAAGNAAANCFPLVRGSFRWVLLGFVFQHN